METRCERKDESRSNKKIEQKNTYVTYVSKVHIIVTQYHMMHIVCDIFNVYMLQPYKVLTTVNDNRKKTKENSDNLQFLFLTHM